MVEAEPKDKNNSNLSFKSGVATIYSAMDGSKE
jgi:hypothetical protein